MKKLNLPFTGAATALVTPFNHDQSVDYGSLSRLIDTQIDAGIHGSHAPREIFYQDRRGELLGTTKNTILKSHLLLLNVTSMV